MSKILTRLTMLVILMTPVVLNAQDDAEKPTGCPISKACAESKKSVFVQFGQNRSVFYGSGSWNDTFDAGDNITFSAGVAAAMCPHFKVKAQVQYLSQSMINSREFFDREGTRHDFGSMSYTSNYIAVPLHIEAAFGKKSFFHVIAGGYMAYRLNTRYTVRGDEGYFAVDENLSSETRAFDTGVCVGTGMSFPVCKKFNMNFDALDYLGIVNVNKIDGGAVLKHNSFMLVGGVEYKFGN